MVGFIKKIIILIMMIVAVLVLLLGFSVGMAVTISECLVVKGYEVWFTYGNAIYFLYVILGLILVFIFDFVNRKFGKVIKLDTENQYITNFIKKNWVITIIGILVSLYMLVINVTSIKDNTFYVRSTFKPFEKSYSLNDVVSVDTGVSENIFAHPFGVPKDTFYYIVEFSNGKSINLNGNMAGEMDGYDKYTYEFIEDIDKNLMKIGKVKKISSSDRLDKLYMDKVYTDIITRIIENK